MSEIENKLLSIAEYAKLKGLRKSSVQYAVEKRKLFKSVSLDTKGRIQIDPEIAQDEWIPNLHIKNKEKEKIKAAISKQKLEITESEIKKDNRTKDWEKEFQDNPVDIAESRAKREFYEAELARLKVEEKEEKLVDAEKVKEAAFRIARSTRDGLMNIPDRVAMEFSLESNQFTIHKRLTEEIRKALESLEINE